MITHQYFEFTPEDDRNFSKERLMSLLTDLIMRYDVSLEEALRILIEKGMTANLFLKEAGMNDLLENFLNETENEISEILKKFTLKKTIDSLQKEISETEKKNSRDSYFKEFRNLLSSGSTDSFRRKLWEAPSELQGKLYQYLEELDDLNTLKNGAEKYPFTGTVSPKSVRQAKKIISRLEELTELRAALREAIESGDLFNMDLGKIAETLGPESFQEFLERREQIFKSIRELLEKGGQVIQNEEGGMELSPSSVQKLGKRALQEIFSSLKNDSSSSSRFTKETGDSENLIASNRALEFGDSTSKIDYISSIQNSVFRGNGRRPSIMDMEVSLARGTSRSGTVVLIDMSGSMARSSRFFNAKKVTLAIDALIRSEYKDDQLTIVGFGTLAKIIPASKVPSLQPYPVTIFDPYIRLRYNMNKMGEKEKEELIPLYFTNLQKGLKTARQILSSRQIRNKNIILITDGAPTAHFKGSILEVNYPPAPSDFEEALREASLCREDNITVNTFLLTSEWDYNYFGEESFIRQFAKSVEGRIFYPHPKELGKMILFDFLENRKKKFSY
ncbi:MAG TPA: VWA domain-containing protein [Leptospiraceae bacterium]|nr:VWA domain-containing protein [Leptospiraceae bacterium]HNF12970.1 VWA domain-containing protein [Leptospiraceae bacterium]HNM02334.1 VWA domain-containing protein [Leptospiraceae bacterium]HNN02745.1 VWA domain-containing protein [Leptospiraceae bacterium]